jgi:hypothetical protein
VKDAEAPLALKPFNFTQKLEVMLSHMDERPELNGEVSTVELMELFVLLILL